MEKKHFNYMTELTLHDYITGAHNDFCTKIIQKPVDFIPCVIIENKNFTGYM